MRLTPRTLLWLLQRSVIAAFDDNCLGIAKGAAYSALLSFFPVLTSAAAILVQTRASFVSGLLQSALSEIVPPRLSDARAAVRRSGGDSDRRHRRGETTRESSSGA